MQVEISFETLLLSVCIGALSAFTAYKRKKNPYLWFGIGFLLGVFGFFAILFFPFFQKRKNKLKNKIVTEAFLSGPKEKLWYYLDAKHNQVGPISYQNICKCLREKTIFPHSYVWHEELQNWQKIESLLQIKHNQSFVSLNDALSTNNVEKQ